jgi:hypothetical protein
VGLPVISVPVSMPVSKDLQPSFSLMYRKLQAEGEFTKMMRDEEERATGKLGSACSVNSAGGSEKRVQLSFSDLSGTFIIAIFIQLLALSLSALEYSTGKTTQEMLGLYDHVLAEHQERTDRPEHAKTSQSHALTAHEFDKFLVDFRHFEQRIVESLKTQSATGACR